MTVKMMVEFEWDGDDLGPTWMNEDNLAILLYSEQCTNRELLSFCVHATTVEDQ